MKINLLFVFILLFAFSNAKSQSVAELYANRNYEELVKFADKTERLNSQDLYSVGYAFFQLENDLKAIEMYDKAIAKGLDTDHIYLYKGLALRYNMQYKEAIKTFKIAIKKYPEGQKNFTELANCFYLQDQYDSALFYFYQARNLDYALGDPYLKIPNIFHIQKDFDKALEEYKLSASLIIKSDPVYVELLKLIGQLEFTSTKNYGNAVKAYSEMLSFAPKRYDLYSKLIKACYANKEYAKGDSVFDILKGKHEEGKLSKNMMDQKGLIVDEFLMNKQKVSVEKFYKEASEVLDMTFRFYLLNKKGTKIIINWT